MPPHRTGVNIPAFRLPPSRPLLGEEKVVVAAGRTHPRLARAAAPATRPQQTKFYPYVGKGGRRPIRGFAGTSTSSPLGASAPSSPFGRGGGWGEVRALSAPLAYLPSPPAPLPAGEGRIAALQGVDTRGRDNPKPAVAPHAVAVTRPPQTSRQPPAEIARLGSRAIVVRIQIHPARHRRRHVEHHPHPLVFITAVGSNHPPADFVTFMPRQRHRFAGHRPVDHLAVVWISFTVRQPRISGIIVNHIEQKVVVIARAARPPIAWRLPFQSRAGVVNRTAVGGRSRGRRLGISGGTSGGRRGRRGGRAATAAIAPAPVRTVVTTRQRCAVSVGAGANLALVITIFTQKSCVLIWCASISIIPTAIYRLSTSRRITRGIITTFFRQLIWVIIFTIRIDRRAIVWRLIPNSTTLSRAINAWPNHTSVRFHSARSTQKPNGDTNDENQLPKLLHSSTITNSMSSFLLRAKSTFPNRDFCAKP